MSIFGSCRVTSIRTRHALIDPRTLRTWLCLCLSVSGACSAAPHTESRAAVGPAAGSGAGVAGDGAVIAEKPACAADNPFCAMAPPLLTASAPGAPVIPQATNCGSVPVDLRPTGVNIMIAVDGAASMMSHWSNVVTAVRSLRENNPTAAFGLHLFWADPVDLASGETNSNTSNNGCALLHDKVLELGDHSATELLATLGSGPPGGTIADSYQVSPVIDPLNTYLTLGAKLADPHRTNYLLVFTGGNDNCFGSAYASEDDKLLAYQKLAIELSKLNIRTIPVGVDAPNVAAMSDTNILAPSLVGTDVANITTNYTVLQTLLDFGGSGLKEVPRIDTPAKLAELVTQVGQTINSCRFEIPATLDSSMSVNPFELGFSINSVVVPRDRHELNGWDFVEGSTSQVEFYGQGCQAVQSGQALVASKSCEQNICGTAAVSVMTKPRVVLLLLDSSASRIECVDGSTDCLSTPGTAGRVPSYWEVVQHAVNVALVAPVNDDVSFGMQFFPSKTSDALSCDVAAAPEIAPAPSKQIAIMKNMLEKLPFGFSPDVAVMESVAAAPGTLADPSAVAAVVLLSDGGDNCSGDTQAQIVARLGAAAKKLLDGGAKTFVIRYGNADGEAPDQAAQLAAIVNNGGTAIAGAAVPYIDAKSPAELSTALANISDRLATCSFALGGVKPDVDKDRTSLYMNGEQIGFDAMNTKLDGWSWVDADRTTIELYGDACSTFKTSRHTNIVAEFGCEPMVIKGPD